VGATERRRGNRAEVDTAAALVRLGWRALTSRSARGGTQAGGDLITDFPAVVEVKDHARLDLAGWWKQACEQAGDDPAVVVHKRRGRADAEDWWVTMDLRTLDRLLREAGS